MRSDLAHFKRQLQTQRDAAALELRRLHNPQATPGGSTSDPNSALSASMASSKLGLAVGIDCLACHLQLSSAICIYCLLVSLCLTHLERKALRHLLSVWAVGKAVCRSILIYIRLRTLHDVASILSMGWLSH